MTKVEESERYPLTATFRWAHRLRDGLRRPWRGAAWLDIRAAGSSAAGVRATLTVRIADAAPLLGAEAGAGAGAGSGTEVGAEDGEGAEEGTGAEAEAQCGQRYAVAVIDCELRRDGRALVAGSPGLPAGRVRCRYEDAGEGRGAGAAVDAVAIVGDLLPLRAEAADLDGR